MFGTAELTDEIVRAAGEGSQPDRARVLEVLEPQVHLMVAARFSPLPNQMDAMEDLSQEALTAVASGLDRLKRQTVAGLFAYTSGIVGRLVALHLRKRPGGTGSRPPVASLDSTITILSQAGPLWQFLSADGGTPSSSASRREQAAKLFGELGKLKAEYREVITLVFFDQLTVTDAAAQLDRTRAATSMLLLRAMRTLRRGMTGSSRVDRNGSAETEQTDERP